MPMLERASMGLVMAFGVALAITAAIFAAGAWTLEDMHVYLEAGRRLREGEALYSTTNPLAAYQYAPWFAAAWIPLTHLPEGPVSAGWSIVLVGASIVAVRPLTRHRSVASLALLLLLLPILLFSSARSGNVQPVLVAVLVTGLERRWGPVAVAAAASLKAFPLAFAIVYLGRREWAKAGLAIGLTVVLVVPMLGFDLDRYTVDGPREGTLYALSPVAWAAPVVCLAALTFWLARRSHSFAWPCAAVTTVMALPRMLTYDITFLLAGLAERPGEDSSVTPTRTKLIS